MKNKFVGLRLDEKEFEELLDRAEILGCSLSDYLRSKLFQSAAHLRNKMNDIALVPIKCYEAEPGSWKSASIVTAWVTEETAGLIQRSFKPGERISIPALHKLKADIRRISHD